MDAGGESSLRARWIRRALLRHTGNASHGARAAAASVVGLADEPVSGDLGTASTVADGVTVLARTRNGFDAQLARHVYVAQVHDLMPATVRTGLLQQGWSGADADAMVVAAPFAVRHPDVERLWQEGRICLAAIAALARGLRALPSQQVEGVVAAVVPYLEGMSVPTVRTWVAHAVELLQPDEADAKEQRNYDRRFLVGSTANGVTHLEGRLPALEGEAVLAALNALAESLRAEDDGLTPGQRRADALITLVNAGAAHGDLPKSAAGLPVAATVSIGLAEAERVAAGRPRPKAATLTEAVLACGRPSRVGAVGADLGTLGDAAARFALCCGDLTGVLVSAPHDPASHDRGSAHVAVGGDPAAMVDRMNGETREAACDAGDGPVGGLGIVAQALANSRLEPLAVGRSQRLATEAQRKALALRDGGCVVTGCTRPPMECQPHHVIGWAEGGATDLADLALACWSHHRKIELGRIEVTRNPDPAGPYWISAFTPRERWRQRAA